jgi:PIN domain nuclease of toxin-antitoxin system
MPRTYEHWPVLLDTHIWLWLVQGSSSLPAATRATISSAATVGNLRIAAITLWEVAMLSSRNRVELGKQAILWLDEALARSGVGVEPLSAQIAVESCELPGRFHRDPADRMIVATARVTNATLLTRDRRILDYAADGHLTAIPA